MQLIVQVRGKTAIGRVTDHLVYRRPDGKERSGLVDEGRRVVGVARVLDGECFTNPEDHPAELDVPDSGQMPGIAMEVSRLVTEAVPVTSDRLDVHRALPWIGCAINSLHPGWAGCRGCARGCQLSRTQSQPTPASRAERPGAGAHVLISPFLLHSVAPSRTKQWEDRQPSCCTCSRWSPSWSAWTSCSSGTSSGPG